MIMFICYIRYKTNSEYNKTLKNTSQITQILQDDDTRSLFHLTFDQIVSTDQIDQLIKFEQRFYRLVLAVYALS